MNNYIQIEGHEIKIVNFADGSVRFLKRIAAFPK